MIGNIDATFVSIGAVNAPSFAPRTVAEPAVLTSYGKRISAARREKGLDQADLARAAKVHVKTVSRWENDRQRPERDQEDVLVEVLGVTREWLRGREEKPVTAPPVARGLPRKVRLWIEEFLLELVRADVSEREVDEARRVLTSPELFRLLSGGEPSDETEPQLLEGLEGYGAAIRNTLRSRGYAIAK